MLKLYIRGHMHQCTCASIAMCLRGCLRARVCVYLQVYIPRKLSSWDRGGDKSQPSTGGDDTHQTPGHLSCSDLGRRKTQAQPSLHFCGQLLSVSCFSVLLTWQPLCQTKQCKRQSSESCPFCHLSWEASEHIIYHVLFVRNKSLSLTHIQGQRNQVLPFEGKSVKYSVNTFKNHHMEQQEPVVQ